jgi:hypothetical protein
VDTHANRLLNYIPNQYQPGALFYETDREALYVTGLMSGMTVWLFAAGTFSAARASFPSDLGVNDAGFLFYIDDYAHFARWDGTAWRLTDGGGGYFVGSAIALGTGYQLCDGTTTDYVVDNTTNLAVSSFTTPNLAGNPNTYMGSGTYTGTINSLTLPIFTGTLDVTGGDLQAGTVVQSGTGTTVATTPHDHDVLPTGTIGLPADPINNMQVAFYFRR